MSSWTTEGIFMPLKEGSEIYEIPTRMETRNQLYGYADPQKQIIGSD
jgi:hypothetical protein